MAKDQFDFMTDFLAKVETRGRANQAAFQVRQSRTADYLAQVQQKKFEAAQRKFEQSLQKNNKELNKKLNPKPKKKATFSADADGSTCFDDLTFEDGIVTATFTDGSIYDYPMSQSQAREWFSDTSLGSYFNEEIR